MPKALFNKGKLHYVGIPEDLFNKVQAKASEDRLYVTQYVHKILESTVEGKVMFKTTTNVSLAPESDEDQF